MASFSGVGGGEPSATQARPAEFQDADPHDLTRKVRLQRPFDGPQDGLYDLGRGLGREGLGQCLPADVEDLADGLLSADQGGVLGEGTPKSLQSGPVDLGDLASELRPEVGFSASLARVRKTRMPIVASRLVRHRFSSAAAFSG